MENPRARYRKYRWIVFLVAMTFGGYYTGARFFSTKPRHMASDMAQISLEPREILKGQLAPLQQNTFQVPNIVHFIWYQSNTIDLRFDKARSVLSAIKNLKPDAVYFHTNNPPTGKYFDMLKEYPVFKIVHREPPKAVIIDPPYETLYADYDKVKILIEQGGIYLDLDVLAIRPFSGVRKYGCTVGLENVVKVCSGVISWAPGHPFLYVCASTPNQPQ